MDEQKSLLKRIGFLLLVTIPALFAAAAGYRRRNDVMETPQYYT